MQSNNKLSSFYDSFIEYQIESGLNDRIYRLYQRVKKLNIKSNSKVLEIGCGIGSLTYLLSKIVRSGSYEAVDVSPKSIEYAKKHLTASNLLFTASDILGYEPTNHPFDFILMFDVLEHIPNENHEELFFKISSWMNHTSILFINIPNPNYIIYDQKNNPEALQEIDQPVFIENLTVAFKKASLELYHFETHSVWVQDDFHFLVVKKHSPFKEIALSDTRNLLQKIKTRLGREYRKYRFNYPV